MKSAEHELRKHFPTVYLTLISILVALAVEGLLGRIGELPEMFVFSLSAILDWLQTSIVVLIASLFWWVISRWACTLPWAFGFFDAVAPLVLLMVLHFMAQSVGANPDRWFAALGVVAVGGSANYLLSARRALPSSSGARRQVLFPASIPASIGLLAILGSILGLGEISTGVQILFNTGVVAVVVVFSIAEYRFWSRTVTEHLAESTAA